MASFQLTGPDGGTYQVDAPDEQSALSAFQQMHSAPPLDQYQQAAQARIANLQAHGVDPAYGPADQFMNGRMFGAMPTVMGALTTPLAMAEHGTWNPVEGYDYAKAEQDARLAAGQQEHPILNAIANVAGGGMTGAQLAGAGITAVPQGAGLMRTALGMGVDGAAQGAATGFLSGEDGSRLSDAATGAAAGGGLGLALPMGAKIASTVAAPIVSNVIARANPEGAAKASLVRAMMESGKTPQELQLSLDNATAAGQPDYSLADALGRPGSEMASTVVRSPGEGSTQMADFLQARQSGQAADVTNVVNEGLNVNGTSAQLTNALTNARQTDAAANYGAARDGAGAVNVAPAVQAIDKQLTPGVNAIVSPMADLGALPIDGKLQWIRDRLATDTNQATDFSRVFGVKRQVDSMISTATAKNDGATVAVLTPIRQQLDDQLASASPAYSNARDTYRQQSQGIDAVDTGRQAATSGRYADTVPAYNALTPPEQSSYRAGYADVLANRAERTTPMTNKALPLMNDKASNELGAMSQYQGPLQPGAQDQLAQAIARSNDMAKTAQRSLTGSNTFNNFANEDAAGLDPGVLLEAAKGNLHGVALDFLRKGANALTGSTPEVRQKLAQALMTRGPDADIAGQFAPLVQQLTARQKLTRGLITGAAGSLGGSSASGTSVSRAP